MDYTKILNSALTVFEPTSRRGRYKTPIAKESKNGTITYIIIPKSILNDLKWTFEMKYSLIVLPNKNWVVCPNPSGFAITGRVGQKVAGTLHLKAVGVAGKQVEGTVEDGLVVFPPNSFYVRGEEDE